MKPLIVANWKMNPKTLVEAKKLFNSVKKGLQPTLRPPASGPLKNIKNAEVVIAPPFLYIPYIRNTKYNIQIGAQDCFWEEKGAYTGEISPKMLKNLGVEYVIIGHSERRRYLKETDEMINKKIKAVLKQELKPILCVENIDQIKGGLKDISQQNIKKIILAYEPVFAIGTGKPCSIEKAKKMNLLIRKTLKGNNKILYGGSVNSENALGYIKEAGFSGLLVGGVSLNAKEFIKLVKNVS